MGMLRRFRILMAVVTLSAIGLAGSASFAAATPSAHVAVLHSTMTGAQEVPGPGDPNASGSTVVVLNAITGTVCYVIRVSGISSPLTAGHIHSAPAGVAGPVVVPFPLTGGPTVFAGCTTADKSLIQKIINHPRRYYTNVHNAQFPGGVIRGQLQPF
ncbi:MAG: hypothetical protein QOF20_2200 [Acidimicrobiaceae bacterium]|jgi:hypothetical protein|nr:hypothetical protein [Acidimicrobiaceae bacterium]MDQ1366193.1 hypothetical protein [Acidimicrobiaceae bacterium]MDQ1369847.1 hypothetical protein [Acidimicrobiaceae bacterium]MDQ1421071.1 hypothetical protein [Acidimicrobiaceae bacterium]MDQ1439804.1 hypothetical protein [Acidimicrobiaceae bacterium]